MSNKMLTTHERTVRYSMRDFIAAVRSQPQLWGRNHPDYHNRDKREMAWHEVARHLYKNFDTVSPAEMQRIVVTLTKRWKNTRDSFFRGHRRNRTQKEQVDEEPVRAYIYDQDLSFLLHSNDEEFAPNDHNATADGDTKYLLVTDNALDSKSIDLDNIKLEKDDNIGIPLKRSTCRNQKKPNSAKKPRTSFSDTSDLDEDQLTNILTGDAISEEFHELSVPEPELSVLTEMTKERAPGTFAKTTPVTQKDRLASAVTAALKETPKERAAALMRAASAAETNKHTSKECVAIAAASNKQSAKTNELPATESDPDQSFFDSIKPVIRNMDIEQKLDFQIEVLKLLKNFRGKN